MLVMGIDPGTLATGFGIVEENTHGKLKLIHAGVISSKSKKKISTRLKYSFDQLTDILQRYRPESIAVEDTFYSCNVKSALKLGQARGMALLAAENFNIPISEYSPLEIKQAVVGYGRADKQQIQLMVQKILTLKDIPHPHDLSDALAVAICHLNNLKFQNKIKKSVQ